MGWTVSFTSRRSDAGSEDTIPAPMNSHSSLCDPPRKSLILPSADILDNVSGGETFRVLSVSLLSSVKGTGPVLVSSSECQLSFEERSD